MAEGGGNFSAALGVVSGIDNRPTEPVPYITQLMLALSGGPGIDGHDGWLTYESTAGNGIMVSDSIEVDEAMYPILVEERRIVDRHHRRRRVVRRAGHRRLLSLADRRHHRLLLRRRRHLPGQGRARRRAGRHLRQLEAPSRRQARAAAGFPHGDIRRGPGGRLPQLRRRRLWRSARPRSRAGRARRQPALAQPRQGGAKSSASRWRPPPTASTGRSMPTKTQALRAARRCALTTTTATQQTSQQTTGSGIMKLQAFGIGVLTAGTMALAVFLGSGQARADDIPSSSARRSRSAGRSRPMTRGPTRRWRWRSTRSTPRAACSAGR